MVVDDVKGGRKLGITKCISNSRGSEDDDDDRGDDGAPKGWRKSTVVWRGSKMFAEKLLANVVKAEMLANNSDPEELLEKFVPVGMVSREFRCNVV